MSNWTSCGRAETILAVRDAGKSPCAARCKYDFEMTDNTVIGINHTLLDSIQGEVRVFLSADSWIVEDGGRDIYPLEYLNSIEVANLPHHEFKIKVGARKNVNEISVMSTSSSTRTGMVQCTCSTGAEESPVSVAIGRPDLRALLDNNLRLARGETGVAVCGPQRLMAKTRCLVAVLSDERAAGRGTGAYGVKLFGEGFGW
jgi:hypothetical protein